MLQNFSVAISVGPRVCFILVSYLNPATSCVDCHMSAENERELQNMHSGSPGCLRLGVSWFNWWVSFAPEFQCCYFCEPSCLFYLSFNFDFYVSKIMHL